ncbi:hypothetical protein [Natrinema gelatinilyticum]|uniref:hypothetical protein n=1 Tax=Natrinema gelatinilyticum TaxID=2961571 RepID=UPI0020C257B0|nr:hypothetical protein [Natrinema gelatinilyticum]
MSKPTGCDAQQNATRSSDAGHGGTLSLLQGGRGDRPSVIPFPSVDGTEYTRAEEEAR